MAYATATNVTDSYQSTLLAQLTADSGSSITDAIITAEAAEQSLMMDSYFIGRYEIPITGPTSVLNVLQPHCIRLTLAGLFQRRLMLESYPSVAKDKEDTMEWLKAIQKGTSSLAGAATTVLVDPTDSVTDIGGTEPRVYNEDAGLL